ncbi:hypothetical protein H6P81_017244 [Aristolochia fimbriata]|uniref:Uncharacterized protein n=1 Tax=Aristolochia fimbriata TaxID=158543 RepID=A0AAV7DXL8_ARIFI|nr:hypothetical protein H6P81_017244 [Aristolochia fimbriata]
MYVLCNAGGEIAVETGKIHYRGEKTALLIVEEGIGYLDLLSRVKSVCGVESEGGPLLLVLMQTDDAPASIAAMASPPSRLLQLPELEIAQNSHATAISTGIEMLLDHLPSNGSTTTAAAAGMASMAAPPSPRLQLSESTSSEIPLLLQNSTAITSTSPPPLDLHPIETSENHQSIPTSGETPLLLLSSSTKDDASDEMKELNQKQASCDKLKIPNPKLVDMEWISSLAKSLMERDMPCEELDIMEEICDKHGYDVDFKVVWQSRNLAIQELGLLEDSEENEKRNKNNKKKKGEEAIKGRKHYASVEVEETEEKQASGDIFMTRKPKLVDMEWISSLAKSLMERDLPCEELDIMEEICDKYGCDIDFEVVWKSRNLALQELGLLEDSDKNVKRNKNKKKKKGEEAIKGGKNDASVEVKERKEKQASGDIFMTRKPKLVDMEWVASLAKSLMEKDLHCTEKYIVDEINNEFGYDVDFNLVWKSRNLALKQIGLVKDEEEADDFDDDFDDEFDDEFDEEEELNKIDNGKKGRKAHMGNAPLNSHLPPLGQMSGMSTPFMANMQPMGNMPFMGPYSNLQNGLNLPPRSFPDFNTSEPQKEVSDISGLQKGVSEIRVLLEEFRRMIMILLIVILLLLLLHHQTGKN